MHRREQQSRQARHPIHAPTRRNHQHGRHCPVPVRSHHIHRSAKRHTADAGLAHRHQLSLDSDEHRRGCIAERCIGHFVDRAQHSRSTHSRHLLCRDSRLVFVSFLFILIRLVEKLSKVTYQNKVLSIYFTFLLPTLKFTLVFTLSIVELFFHTFEIFLLF